MSEGDREKELAICALEKYNEADYLACLSALEQLEILRPSDVKVAHNKIVAQCRADGGPVPLAEVLQQLEGLAKTAGISSKLLVVGYAYFTIFVLYMLC